MSLAGHFPAPYMYQSNARGSVVSDRVIKERRSPQSGGVLFFFVVLKGDGGTSVAADQVGWLSVTLFRRKSAL